MPRETCPSCGTRISYWRTQRQRSGRLGEGLAPMVCPACGTAVRWSVGRWRWVHSSLLVAGILFMSYLLMGDFSRTERQWSLLAFCVAAGVVRIVLELLAARLVRVEDE